jgi:hypothetical protein
MYVPAVARADFLIKSLLEFFIDFLISDLGLLISIF